MAVALTGAKTCGATRETVWAALNDVDCLKLCIPGCQGIQREVDRSFRLKVLVRLGPARIEFSGSIEVTESDFPRTYVMTGRGDGGLAGLAKGTAHIRLVELPGGGCRLVYRVETSQDGPLANLGVLFLSGIAKTMTEQFVSALASFVCAAQNAEPGAARRAPSSAAFSSWNDPLIRSGDPFP